MIRQLGHDIVGHHAGDALLDELADTLAGCSTRIGQGEHRSRDKAGFHEHWDTNIAEGDPIESWSDRPISGITSPWGLEPDVRRHGDGVIARVTFG